MHENARIVARAYQAFNEADLDTLTELFDEKVSWHTPGRATLAGDHVGRDAVFTQFGRYLQDTGGTFKAELRTVLSDDEGRVVGIHHNSATRDGKRLDVDCCIVFRVENGRIHSGGEHFYNLHAWDEFWAE